jgi:cobyrinic acid a,c-diamide synthase
MRVFADTNRPVLAECGGMMVLFDTLTTQDGAEHQMAGLLPGKVMMGQRLAAIGLQSLALPEGELSGHTFHYSRIETPLDPVCRCIPYRYGVGEYVYRHGAILASYLHAYFPSNRGLSPLCFGTYQTRLPPCAAISSFPSPGRYRDALAATRRSAKSAKFPIN